MAEGKQQGYEVKHIAFFPRQLEIVERAMEDLVLSPRSGFSQAVRYIIEDWARMKAKAGAENGEE